MTFDERLDRLTERHEALTRHVEILTADIQSLTSDVKSLIVGFTHISDSMGEVISSLKDLTEIARGHERRIDRLEGQA